MLIVGTRFLMFGHSAFRVVYHTEKAPTPNPISGKTLIKFTHACFPPTHPYTITSACLSVDLLSIESIKKLTDASFFIDTLVRLN